jgi:electron transport complex protein RnfC
MKLFTFPGGVHPSYRKDISIIEPLRDAPLPDIAVVPLSQHIGTPNEPVVKKGDEVLEGQVIGASGSFVSSKVHAPVSGEILDIKKAFHPALGPVLSVFIETNKDKGLVSFSEQDIDSFSKEELVRKIKDAGVVGMGGAAFPTHVKFSIPEGRKIKTLIINGAECEPYLTCDHMLMTKKAKEILIGVGLISRIIEPENIYIAVEDNKKAAIFAFQKTIKKYAYRLPAGVKVAALKTKYPQGGEKQIIKAITGKEVPPGKLPLDIGFLVQNAGTVNAVYEAITFNKPLIERIVTVSGDCMENPGNFLMKIGTTIKEIREKCGLVFTREPSKIVVGGPMMGFAQPGDMSPVLKNTSGVLFLSDKAAKRFDEQPCIRCAKCVDVCPMRLLPTEIMRNVKANRYEELEKLFISDCMECGSCNYICPARIPLVQYIKEGKAVISRKSVK